MVTDRFFSNEALSLTGVSKFRMTGIPTPTVLPFEGKIVGYTCWLSARSAEENFVLVVVVVPSLLAAPTEVMVYFAFGSSRSVAVHEVLSVLSPPLIEPAVALPLASWPL